MINNSLKGKNAPSMYNVFGELDSLYRGWDPTAVAALKRAYYGLSTAEEGSLRAPSERHPPRSTTPQIKLNSIPFDVPPEIATIDDEIKALQVKLNGAKLKQKVLHKKLATEKLRKKLEEDELLLERDHTTLTTTQLRARIELLATSSNNLGAVGTLPWIRRRRKLVNYVASTIQPGDEETEDGLLSHLIAAPCIRLPQGQVPRSKGFEIPMRYMLREIASGRKKTLMTPCTDTYLRPIRRRVDE